MTATMVKLGVALETSCAWEMCGQFSRPLFEQMSSGRYDEVSLMGIPAEIGGWRADHRTARKRADRCERRGYTVRRVDRHQYGDDINAINRSATHRQERPMSEGYMVSQTFAPLPGYPCPRHAIRTYGVLTDDKLVAYLWLYRAGDLALVSQILGHADFLRDEIMYLLWQGMLAGESATDPYGVVVYNRHDSGTDGLRFFKERVGLRETAVEWLP